MIELNLKNAKYAQVGISNESNVREATYDIKRKFWEIEGYADAADELLTEDVVSAASVKFLADKGYFDELLSRNVKVIFLVTSEIARNSFILIPPKSIIDFARVTSMSGMDMDNPASSANWNRFIDTIKYDIIIEIRIRA